MYRSASTSRVSDDYYLHASLSPSSKASTGIRTLSFEANEMPVYDPLSEAAKKERSRAKFAENAVHVIPLVLILCAIILWFFSNPDVGLGIKATDPIAARIEGLIIEGDNDNDSDGTQTGFLPMLELGDLDAPKKIDDQKASRKLENKFK